jgi:hypothetical protein
MGMTQGSMKSELTDENANATHFLFIAVRGQGGKHKDETAYAWCLYNPKGERIAADNSTHSGPIRTWSSRAVLQVLAAALKKCDLPRGSHLHVISREWINGKLNEDWLSRRDQGYRRRSDKGHLKDPDIWEEVDHLLEQRQLGISAGPPKTKHGEHILDAQSDFTKTLRRNIDNRGDWATDFGPPVDIGNGPKEPAKRVPPNCEDFPISNDIPPPTTAPKRKGRKRGRR